MGKSRKHKHKHRAVSIQYRGKADSVDLTCDCGHTECLATWYEKVPDWESWPKLRNVIISFLEYWNKVR